LAGKNKIESNYPEWKDEANQALREKSDADEEVEAEEG